MVARILVLLQRPKAALGIGQQASSIQTWIEQPIANQHLAGCSSKLSEGDVYLAMAKVEQAVQQQDSAAIAQWLAPQALVVIDMRHADMPEPLRLNKSEYLQLLDAGWSAAGNRYTHERSNTRVEMAPGGRTATAYATIRENAALQGQPVTSVSDEVATFALLDGKLQITYVQATVLSMQ